MNQESLLTIGFALVIAIGCGVSNAHQEQDGAVGPDPKQVPLT